MARDSFQGGLGWPRPDQIPVTPLVVRGCSREATFGASDERPYSFDCPPLELNVTTRGDVRSRSGTNVAVHSLPCWRWWRDT